MLKIQIKGKPGRMTGPLLQVSFFCVIVWNRNGGRPRETGDVPKVTRAHSLLMKALICCFATLTHPEVPASNVSEDGNVDA